MSLLDSAYDLVHDYPGGAPALGARMKKNATTLSHEVKGEGTAKLGLMDAKKMSDLSGDLRILQAWAVDAGQLLIPLPCVDDPGDQCLAQLSRSAKEFSDLVAEVSTDLADGTISDNELARIEREAGELIANVHALMGAVRQRNQACKPLSQREVP